MTPISTTATSLLLWTLQVDLENRRHTDPPARAIPAVTDTDQRSGPLLRRPRDPRPPTGTDSRTRHRLATTSRGRPFTPPAVIRDLIREVIREVIRVRVRERFVSARVVGCAAAPALAALSWAPAPPVAALPAGWGRSSWRGPCRRTPDAVEVDTSGTDPGTDPGTTTGTGAGGWAPAVQMRASSCSVQNELQDPRDDVAFDAGGVAAGRGQPGRVAIVFEQSRRFRGRGCAPTVILCEGRSGRPLRSGRPRQLLEMSGDATWLEVLRLRLDLVDPEVDGHRHRVEGERSETSAPTTHRPGCAGLCGDHSGRVEGRSGFKRDGRRRRGTGGRLFG